MNRRLQSHQRALEVQNQASVAVPSWKVIPRKIIMMKKSIYCKKLLSRRTARLCNYNRTIKCISFPGYIIYSLDHCLFFITRELIFVLYRRVSGDASSQLLSSIVPSMKNHFRFEEIRLALYLL